MRKNFLFYEMLTEKEKESLKQKDFLKGEEVKFSEEIDKLYFILEGEVKTIKNIETSILSYSSISSTNYLLGVLKVLMEKKFTDEVIVISDILKTIEIPKEIILRLKKESIEFNNYLIDLILKRTQDEWMNLFVKDSTNLKGFIAYSLIKDSKNNYLYINNYNEFIEKLNISVHGFYKIINQLISEKIIEKSEKTIKILKRKELEEMYSNIIE